MRQLRIKPSLTASILVCIAVYPGYAFPAGAAMTAKLMPTEGNKARGQLTFTPASGDKVQVKVQLSRLPHAGEYGLHIHEIGDCSAPDAKSAGGHFNPLSKNHGDRKALERHAGDMGNVTADASGGATATFDIEGVTLDSGTAGIIGKSVVLHANADDLKSQPAGNSGARIACGVIDGAPAKAPKAPG